MMQWRKKIVVATEGEARIKEKRNFIFWASQDDVGKLFTLRQFIDRRVPLPVIV